jgi:hypothetical protein
MDTMTDLCNHEEGHNTVTAIVRVDARPYRVIAQENWGLTDGQMKGMHVHHRIPISEGGTNDASNLYVCSGSYHAWVWHNGRYAGVFALDADRSAAGKVGGARAAETQREKKIGLFGLTTEERSKNTKKQWEDPKHRDFMTQVAKTAGKSTYERKLGAFAPENLGKGAKTTNSQKWVDPDHPELGAHHFNVLKKLQRENGYPSEKINRVKSPQ